MKLRKALGALAVGVVALTSAAISAPAMAEDLTMWMRSGHNPIVDTLVERWNKENPDRKINITVITHTEMVPKIAQAIASGEVPDFMGMDLIYGPQFEKSGGLVDITDKIKDWPELKTASPGHMAVATYEGKLYGVPLYADLSLLIRNNDLLKKAGLDPNKPPQTLDEITQYAKKITGIEPDVFGYFFAGSCAGCNIFTYAPLMWAQGVKVEPKDAGDEPLTGDAVKPTLQWARDLVASGQTPPSARAENGENFAKVFTSGKIGMMGHGNFIIGELAKNNPGMDYGISCLPGAKAGQSSSFAGGDIVVIPKGSKHVDDAVAFMKWLLSDEIQVEGYAANLDMVTRSDQSDNKYYNDNPKVQAAASCLGVTYTPYTLKFFDLINSPQGPWLQMLQRAFFTTDNLDTVIADAKAKMSEIINE
jgi:multiple sugar transport system substrate-binding protein